MTDVPQRALFPTKSRHGKSVVMANVPYVTFTSNDYLGLAQDLGLAEAATQTLVTSGMGSGGSRLLGGDTDLAHGLEAHLSEALGAESALVWASGYQTNLGILSVLADKQDIVFADRFIHASWVDGVRLAGTRIQRFRHNDMTHLEALLKRYRGSCRRAIILVESLYSMDGDCAPLAALCRLKDAYDTLLVIDEAHAFGVLGPNGFGCWASYRQDACGIERAVPFQRHPKPPVCGNAETGVFIVGTFGKACGAYGAFVACDTHWRQAFIQSARSFIYSTGLPLPVLAWNLAVVSQFSRYRALREKLWSNVAFFRDKIKALSPLGTSMIVPILLKEGTADAVVLALRDLGFWVACVRYPTVPKGQSRLRLSLCADHSKADLSALALHLMALLYVQE